ncbi:hypothetical protein niasHS_009665 [Heterodera schachtii]|uniref:Uncharacterized protein n=1 Tax=Heterodera schachtii TaxID=97005 RepID=A0ABD2J0V9_HETSC
MLLFKFAKFTSLFIIFVHLLCQSDQTAELAHGSNGVGDSFKSGGDFVDAASNLVNEANEGTISDDLAIEGMKKISVGVMCNDNAKFESKMDNLGKLRNNLCKQFKSDGQNLEVFVENIVNIFTNNDLPTVLSNAINEIEKKALLNDQNKQNIGTFRHNFNGIYETIANNANIFHCHDHHHHPKMMAITAKNGRRRKRGAKKENGGDIEMGQNHNHDHDEDSSSEGSGESGKKCCCRCGKKTWIVIIIIAVAFAVVVPIWAKQVLFSKDSISYIGPGN